MEQPGRSGGNLMGIALTDQHGFDIMARTPADSDRVVVTMARFPRGCVLGITNA
jgi:hypothetical protein